MSNIPLACVVDTNVTTTANEANPGASRECVARSSAALLAVVRKGHVFIDDAGAIVDEYRRNLRPRGEPGVGDAFFKWLLTHEWNEEKVTRVTITPKEADPEDYEELPAPSDGTAYDRSDRKFLAVSAAHPKRPPILQSFDSKWWGWQESLKRIGVRIHFLCQDDIEAKHAEKMGT